MVNGSYVGKYESIEGKMRELTKEQKEVIKEIENMSHYAMCSLWRFAPSGHLYFDNTLIYSEIFEKRFEKFGGFTSEISKSLGW